MYNLIIILTLYNYYFIFRYSGLIFIEKIFKVLVLLQLVIGYTQIVFHNAFDFIKTPAYRITERISLLNTEPSYTFPQLVLCLLCYCGIRYFNQKRFKLIDYLVLLAGFILLMFIAFSINASAQWTDFPVGYSAIPKTKLKGVVHTVLTTEQRDEHVFRTDVEVYDKSGRLIESLETNANIEIHSGSLVRLGRKTTFTYDSSGKLVKEKYFTPEGEYYGYTTHLYDYKNFLIREISFDTKGKETLKTTYTYFPEKRQVEVKWSIMKVLLSYNEKNQWIKRDDNGNVNFEYDNTQNLVKESHGSYWHNLQL
jgi:hypothetical protein